MYYVMSCGHTYLYISRLQPPPNAPPPYASTTPHTQVDPLRSLAKNRPEFGAYRVYPPEYTAPANQVRVCPGWHVYGWMVSRGEVKRFSFFGGLCPYRHTSRPTVNPPTHSSIHTEPPVSLCSVCRCRTGRRWWTTRRAWSAGAAAGTGKVACIALDCMTPPPLPPPPPPPHEDTCRMDRSRWIDRSIHPSIDPSIHLSYPSHPQRK